VSAAASQPDPSALAPFVQTSNQANKTETSERVACGFEAAIHQRLVRSKVGEDMSAPLSVEARYARLAEVFLKRPSVTHDSGGKGFGSSALKVDGRIFAMLSSRSEFVVKLPRKRVDELVESGHGRAFDAGKGRPMKVWLVVTPASSLDWSSIAEEALDFVGGVSTQA
jgi:hypothetical protein